MPHHDTNVTPLHTAMLLAAIVLAVLIAAAVIR